MTEHRAVPRSVPRSVLRSVLRSVAALLLSALVLAGCSGQSSTPSSTSPTPTRAPGSVSLPPSGASLVAISTAPTSRPDIPFSACGNEAQKLRLTDAAAHVRLDGWITGPSRARTAVVFLHEAGNQGACGWWDYGSWLSRTAGVRSYLVQRCGYGSSVCPRELSGLAQNRAETQPAVDDARRHGATRVVLVGASAGATDALVNASAVHGINAVVALSADITDTDAVFDPRTVRLPTLLAYANNDPLCPPEQQRSWYARIPATHKRLVLGAEALHGWALVADDDGFVTPVGRTVAAWVQGRYG